MTQCPGYAYDSFWENENGDNEPTFDIDKLTRGKTYDKDLNKWVEQTTRYRIDYYKKGDLPRRWKYRKTMNSAITKAYEMIQTGEYTIIGIEIEYDLTPS
jgi:hypothetical protein